MSKILTLTAAALIATPAAAAPGKGADEQSRPNYQPPAAIASDPSVMTRGGDRRSGTSHNLRLALQRMVRSNGDNPPGQDKRPFDPDMGDDNASDRAIFEVCTKNRPAAQRSAICRRGPISPH